MTTQKIFGICLLVITMLALAACGGPNADTGTNNQIAPSGANQAEDTPAENTAGNDSQADAITPQPPEAQAWFAPQPVQIPTSDGRTLEGVYYPAETENAALILLLHWAPGTMADWDAIAPWLQNRPERADFPEDDWFPPMPEQASFAVLTFNFGGYGESEGGRPTWVLDAQAAVQFAAALPGVDPEQIAALGASIGADGAVDGCYLFNQSGETGACIGAFSLSPSNYITDDFSYSEATAALDAAGAPVWCLAAEADGGSPDTCRAAGGEHYRAFIFPGSPHGMQLIEPDFYPIDPQLNVDVLQLVQEWLEAVFGLPLNDFSLE